MLRQRRKEPRKGAGIIEEGNKGKRIGGEKGKPRRKRKRINEGIKIPQTFRRKLITKVMRKRAITLKKTKTKITIGESQLVTSKR